MSRFSLFLLGAASAIAVAASSAAAQDQQPVTVDQLNLDVSISNLRVRTDGLDGDAVLQSTAAANAAAAQFTNQDVTAVVNQTSRGATLARTSVASRDGAAPSISGVLQSTTSAIANSADTVALIGDNQTDISQLSRGQTAGRTNINAGDLTTAVATTTAAANTASAVAVDGALDASVAQTVRRPGVAASTTLRATTADDVVGVTTAAGNSFTAEGLVASNISQVGQTVGRGSIRAASNIDIDTVNGSVTNVSTASANSIEVFNESGFTSLGLQGQPATQTNRAGVAAVANTSVGSLTLDDGFANTAALGIGNTANVTNLSDSDTGAFLSQVNTGGVSARASQTGAIGGVSVVDASAFGNAASITAITPEGSLARTDAGLNQLNRGPTTARTSINGAVGSVVGSATSVGNTATITSNRSLIQGD